MWALQEVSITWNGDELSGKELASTQAALDLPLV